MKRILFVLLAMFIAGNSIVRAQSSLPDLAKSLEWIKKHVAEVESGTFTYKQSFEYDSNVLWRIIFSSDKAGKSSAIKSIYEFNLADLDENKVDYKVIGKTITLHISTQSEHKAIKYTKDGTLHNYCSSLEIVIQDIENARDLVEAFKHSIILARENQKAWFQKE